MWNKKEFYKNVVGTDLILLRLNYNEEMKVEYLVSLVEKRVDAFKIILIT